MKSISLFLSLLLCASTFIVAQETDTSYYKNGKISSISFDSTFSNKRFNSYLGFSKSGEVKYLNSSITNSVKTDTSRFYNYFDNFSNTLLNIGNFLITKEYYKSGRKRSVDHMGVEELTNFEIDTWFHRNGNIQNISSNQTSKQGKSATYEKEFYRSGIIKNIWHYSSSNNFEFDTTFNRHGQLKSHTYVADTLDYFVVFGYHKNGDLSSKWISNSHTDLNIDTSWNKKGLITYTSKWDSIYSSKNLKYYADGPLYEVVERFDFRNHRYYLVKNFYKNGVLKKEYCTKRAKKHLVGLITPIGGHVSKDSIERFSEIPHKQYIKEYYQNGVLKNTYFIDKKGNYDSLFYTYYETGELLGIIEYKNKKMLNAQYFNKDGSTMESGNFKNGNGRLTMYENGYAIRKCMFKNGRAKCKCD